MIFTLRQLYAWANDREIEHGVWVPARPMVGPLPTRFRAAWAVLTGRADAFTWPDKDPETWCGNGQTRPRRPSTARWEV